MAGDDSQKAVGIFWLLERTVEQGFDKAFDRSDGGLQFVRDVGDEIAAEIFQMMIASDVVEHDYRADAGAAAIAQRGAADAENALRLAVKDDIVFDRVGRFQGARRSGAGRHCG